jgi:hypothetical protein
MKIVGAYLIVCVGLVVFGAAGDVRPFTLVGYALALATVAGLLTGFNAYRARSLREIMGRIKGAAPTIPTGIVEAPTEKVARLLDELRRLGFAQIGTTITTVGGAPPMQGWIMIREPGTTWVEVGVPEAPMAIFLSQGADGRFLETTTAGGELIDHPALYARTLKADPAGAFAAHRQTLAEWEARTGPARVVRTLDDYLEAEKAQRDLTGGLRIATFLERVVDPGIRQWAAATVISIAAVAALWGLDIARR